MTEIAKHTPTPGTAADETAARGELPPEVTKAFGYYRIMSYVVGVMLLIMCCIGLPLQYVANKPSLPNIGWQIHGLFYIVYLISAANLARRARFSLGQLLGVVCAGFLPGLAFLMEHRTALRILGQPR